jgi:hypothetical protein
MNIKFFQKALLPYCANYKLDNNSLSFEYRNLNDDDTISLNYDLNEVFEEHKEDHSIISLFYNRSAHVIKYPFDFFWINSTKQTYSSKINIRDYGDSNGNYRLMDLYVPSKQKTLDECTLIVRFYNIDYANQRRIDWSKGVVTHEFYQKRLDVVPPPPQIILNEKNSDVIESDIKSQTDSYIKKLTPELKFYYNSNLIISNSENSFFSDEEVLSYRNEIFPTVEIVGDNTMSVNSEKNYVISCSDPEIEIYLETTKGIINYSRVYSGTSITLSSSNLNVGDEIKLKAGFKYWSGKSEKIINVV